MGVSCALAFQWITGVVYCLAPVMLFVMAWRLTRAPLAACVAGLVYSLTSLTQWIVPDGPFTWNEAVNPRRFYLVAVWDDTPHLTALALLPLVVVLLWRTLEHRRWRYFIPVVIVIALMTSASQFGPMEVAMAAISMVFVFPKIQWRRNLAIVAAVGALSYGLAASVLSPSLMRAIGAASSGGGEGVSTNAYAGFAALGGGFVALGLLLRRWNIDPRVQFSVLFAYLASSVPVLSATLIWDFCRSPAATNSRWRWRWPC